MREVGPYLTGVWLWGPIWRGTGLRYIARVVKSGNFYNSVHRHVTMCIKIAQNLFLTGISSNKDHQRLMVDPMFMIVYNSGLLLGPRGASLQEAFQFLSHKLLVLAHNLMLLAHNFMLLVIYTPVTGK